MTHFAFVRFVNNYRWDVDCSVCDFQVTHLGTFEAAEDTAAWHEGKPSMLGSWSA